MIRHPDYITGAFLVALGAGMFYLSFNLATAGAIATFSPRFFPQLASAGIVLCGLGVLAQAAMAESKPLPFLFNRANFLIAAIFIVYFTTFERFDFRISSWLVILLSMFVLGCRSWIQLAVVPAATSLLVYWTFTRGFEVVLPTWI